MGKGQIKRAAGAGKEGNHRDTEISLVSKNLMAVHDDTLFDMAPDPAFAPLPERMRPKRFEDIVGQEHFLNERFKNLIRSEKWTGLIFWGPPGTGKTSLARVISAQTNRKYVPLSAVNTGAKEIREVMEASSAEVSRGLPSWIVFIDEIHRLNKAQQDIVLPYLERGAAKLIGATTENPSFSVNKAVCSRSLIFKLLPISLESSQELLTRAIPKGVMIAPTVIDKLARLSGGDARRALNWLEQLVELARDGKEVVDGDLEQLMSAQGIKYDRNDDVHFDTISAYIKSVRGGAPDAALYYLARMLEGGEDPAFISRRLIILASEDIGNANPSALLLAVATQEAVEKIGMPEARIPLAQATIYLACSEKSNRSYVAINDAIAAVQKTGAAEIPLHLRNAPTQLMKDMGYSKGYQYPHSFEGAWVDEEYMPAGLTNLKFYVPSDHGVESKLKEFLAKHTK